MAYNLFAETEEKINWDELHKKIPTQIFVEYVPMPQMGINGGDALGISIPSKNVNSKAWEELKIAIDMLKNEFQLDIYDMYFGAKIDSKLMDKIKENLTT